MLNTLLPALLFSWGFTLLLFRWLNRVEANWLRFALRAFIFSVTFLAGVIGSFVSFFLSLWALSGMPISEFVNATIGAGQLIMSWAGPGLFGAFIGAFIGQCRKW